MGAPGLANSPLVGAGVLEEGVVAGGVVGAGVLAAGVGVAAAPKRMVRIMLCYRRDPNLPGSRNG